MKFEIAKRLCEEYLDKGKNKFMPKDMTSRELNFAFIKVLKKIDDDNLADLFEAAFKGNKTAKTKLKRWLWSSTREHYSDDVLNVAYNIIRG